MRILIPILLLFAFLTSACESKWVARAKAFRNKACSCVDRECLQEAAAMFDSFVSGASGKKVKKSDKKKIDHNMLEGAKCLRKLKKELEEAKRARRKHESKTADDQPSSEDAQEAVNRTVRQQAAAENNCDLNEVVLTKRFADAEIYFLDVCEKELAYQWRCAIKTCDNATGKGYRFVEVDRK